jgi:hypothetical protein
VKPDPLDYATDETDAAARRARDAEFRYRIPGIVFVAVLGAAVAVYGVLFWYFNTHPT